MSLIGTIFKQPSQRNIVDFDFSADIAGAGTISSSTVTSKDEYEPSNVLKQNDILWNGVAGGGALEGDAALGSQTVAGKIVSIGYMGGANGEVHILECKVTASDGKKHEKEYRIIVREEPW